MNKIKYKRVLIDFLDTEVVFTYGKKAYRQYLKDIYNINKTFNKSGVATELQSDIHYSNVIGLQKNKNNIYALKSIMVHEVSHSVTHIMNHYQIDCDEFRSYLNQYIYSQGIHFLESIIKEYH